MQHVNRELRRTCRQAIMDRWLGKTAVVTGAASGIGEAITHALLQNGVNVAALDIQKERLAKLEAECRQEGFQGTLHTIHCDVSRKDDIDAAFSHVETLGGVDIMVNNAGVCEYSRVIESDRESLEKLLNINLLAVAVCINKAVGSMRKRNVEGHVVNINSILGHLILGKSNFNLYAATKHGSVALTHIVRREIADVKVPIRITSISPGLVKTNIAAHSEEITNYLKNASCLEPKDIANGVIYALGTRPEVQIMELTIGPSGQLP